MLLIAVALFVPAAGCILSLLASPRPRAASVLGIACGAISSLIMLALSLLALFTNYSCRGALPPDIFCEFNSFRAIFMIPISLIGFAGIIHSIKYIGPEPKHGISGVYYAAYNLTMLAMMCCTLFTVPLYFLLAWEIMGLASFVLVYFDFRTRGVDRASWIYLLSCEAGGLLLMFAFSRLSSDASSAAALICGLLGFGLKAGFPILHVWLPKAHPAAPAPVSALMSGAMVNLGIFGIVTFFNVNTAACGWTLGILGLSGALSGILFSLTKRNIKAALAYSTVENCGIITFGIGCGILGGAYKLSGLEIYGYLGAFLHLINHASLKGALFLGAGSVYHATGSLDADKLGGLIRKMPSTGKMFTFASLALSGLPPFNAFISELLIYIALFTGLSGSKDPSISVFCAAGIIILGATGAIALASLVRVSSCVFFGEPRNKEIFEAAEKENPVMGRAIFLTLIPSLIISLAADKTTHLIFEAISVLFSCGNDADLASAALTHINAILHPLCKMNIIICCLTVIFFSASSMLRRRHRVLTGPTWDCGYIKPTARMQYTSTALVQSITDFFSPLFGIASRRRGDAITGEQGSDPADRVFWNFLFRITAKWSEKIHRFQSGYLHFYILVMVTALTVLLLWAYFSGVGK